MKVTITWKIRSNVERARIWNRVIVAHYQLEQTKSNIKTVINHSASQIRSTTTDALVENSGLL